MDSPLTKIAILYEVQNGETEEVTVETQAGFKPYMSYVHLHGLFLGEGDYGEWISPGRLIMATVVKE